VFILVFVVLDVLLAVLRVMLVDVSHLNNCALLTQLDNIAVVGLGFNLPCHRVEPHNQSASLADLLGDDGKFSCTC
jgi:predicted amino acid racemase